MNKLYNYTILYNNIYSTCNTPYTNVNMVNSIKIKKIIFKREAPAFIPNDGKQTPTKGHPVFVAQHATATCCRGCLEKWHRIPKGRELTWEEQEYVVDVIMEWISREMKK